MLRSLPVLVAVLHIAPAHAIIQNICDSLDMSFLGNKVAVFFDAGATVTPPGLSKCVASGTDVGRHMYICFCDYWWNNCCYCFLAKIFWKNGTRRWPRRLY